VASMIQLDGVGALLKNLERFDGRVRQRIGTELERAARNIEREAKQAAPVDTGDHRARIHVRHPAPFEQEVVAPASAYLEFGSAPHHPPIEPLKAWAKRHGMDEGVAYAIQAKIAREGTPPRPFMVPAAEREAPRLRRALERVMRDETSGAGSPAGDGAAGRPPR
jgi:hypothetical protein